MNIQAFLKALPDHYVDWGLLSITPKLSKFQELLNQTPGMTTANILQLLNLAVSHLDPDEAYCEISRDSLTLTAATINQSHPAYRANHTQNQHEFFTSLYQTQIGVYFYDGAHDYHSVLLGLRLITPLLAPQAIIIIDDANDGQVRQAIKDFLATHSHYKILYDYPTPYNGHSSFWNGLIIIGHSKTTFPEYNQLLYLRHGYKPTQTIWDLSYRSYLISAIESCHNLIIIGQPDQALQDYLTSFANVTVQPNIQLFDAAEYDGIIWHHGIEYLEKWDAIRIIKNIKNLIPMGVIQTNNGDVGAQKSTWNSRDFTDLGLNWRYYGPGDYRYYTNYLIGYWCI